MVSKEKAQNRKRNCRKNSLKCIYCPKIFLNTRYIVPHLIAIHGEKSIEKKNKGKKGIHKKELFSLDPPKASQDYQENFDVKVESLNDDYYSDSVSEPDSEGQYMPNSLDLQSYLNKIVEDEYVHLT